MGDQSFERSTSHEIDATDFSSSDLISLLDATAPVFKEDDEDILTFDPFFPIIGTPSPAKIITYNPIPSKSLLRAEPPTFAPSLQPLGPYHVPEEDEIRHSPQHRIRKSGTTPPTFVEFTSSPIVSRSSSSASLSRYRSPSVSPPSTPSTAPRFQAFRSARRPSSSTLPSFISRNGSASLPDLGISGETTPPSSNTLHSPVSSAREGPDVILSKEEDIDRLFSFAYADQSVGKLEEPLLVDISPTSDKANNEINPTCKHKLSPAPTPPLLDQSVVSHPRPAGAKLISVEPIEDCSIPLGVASTPRITTAVPKLRIKAKTLNTEEKHKRKGEPIEVLVELDSTPTDSSHGMRRPGGREIYQGILKDLRMSARAGNRKDGGNRVDGEGVLVDVGLPIKPSGRAASDVKNLRQRMGLDGTSSSSRHSQTAASGRKGDMSGSIRNHIPQPRSNEYTQIYNQFQAISPYRQLLSRKSPRRNVPTRLQDPDGSDPLQRTLIEAWQRTEPSRRNRQYVSDLLENLSVMINRRLGDHSGMTQRGRRRFEVDVFGSVSWGGETGSSGDLDLIVLMPKGYEPKVWQAPPGQVVGSRGRQTPIRHMPKVYTMYALESQLRQMGMINTQAIAHATTPIVKFVDEVENTECDINVNDLGGWYNSSLILHYCLISPHVLRPLIHAIKLWAKAFEVNDNSGSKTTPAFSSYCLTLMAIAYLQHLGHLPNLQANAEAILPEDNAREDEDVIWVGWGKPQGTKAHIGFERSPPPGWKSQGANPFVSDAVRGFFRFYNTRATDRNGRFQHETEIVSILQGGIAPRARPHAFSARAAAKERKELEEQGIPHDKINQLMSQQMAMEKAMDMANDRNVGKGDEGVQPSKWEASNIIVQDPFLWHKNCAAGMSRDGWARFQRAVHLTEERLQNPSTKFEDILQNPFPSVLRETPLPPGTTPWGRRRKGASANGPPAGGRESNSPYPREGSRGGRGRGGKTSTNDRFLL